MDKPKVQTEPQGSENAAPVTIYQKLAKIQKELKAPKSQYNSFSSYNYRNCEDILEALKPLLDKDTVIIINDEIVQVGDRYYVKATATITDGIGSVHNTAFARESLDKKGMDDSQITGATSSYARKYALNGLLAIDDAKDADSHDNRAKNPAQAAQRANPAAKPPTTQPGPTPAKPQQPPTGPKVYLASEKQLKYMATLCSETGIDREKLKEEYKVTSAKELTSSQASQIINQLMQMPKLPKQAPKAETPPTAPTVGSPEAAQQPKPTTQAPPKTVEAMTVTEIMNSTMTPEEKAAAMQKRIGVHVTTAAQLPEKPKA